MLLRSTKMFDEGDNAGWENPDLISDLDPRNLTDDETIETDDEVLEETPDEDEIPDLDDVKLLKVLEKKGIKTDSLTKIDAALKDLPALTRKHQLTKGELKAVRARLEAQGIDPDDFIREARDSYNGSSKSTSKERATPEPLRNRKPEELKALGEIMDHFMGPKLEGFREEAIPLIARAVIDHLDFRSFAKSVDEEPDSLKEKLQTVADRYQIGGRDQATLKVLWKLYNDELNEGIEGLKDNEKDVHPKTKRGAPPPTTQHRKGSDVLSKTEGLTDEEWRQKHEKEFGKK